MATGQAGAEIGVGMGPTLTCNHEAPVVVFQTRVARNGRGAPSDVCPALGGADAGATSDMRPCLISGTAVRRLTPAECEALQGFPVGYTLVPFNGKLAKDGPRYKAIGNSWAVPVVRLIGERIAMVDAIRTLK